VAPGAGYGQVYKRNRCLASRRNETMTGTFKLRNTGPELKGRRGAVGSIAIGKMSLIPVIAHIGGALQEGRRAAVGGRCKGLKPCRCACLGMNQ
jgi:hypothetical protein